MHHASPSRRSFLVRCARVSCALGAWFALAASASDGSQVSAGFVEHVLVHYSQEQLFAFGGMAVLPDGSLILYDGARVVRRDAATGAEQVLFTPEDTPVFGNFFRVAPDRKSVYFGVNHKSESSAPHSIYRLPIDPVVPDAAEEADVLRFNFDLAFDDKGRGFVSAFASGENRIFLLDNDPRAENDPVVVGIPGYSGPLAFLDGRLYYATTVWGQPNALVYFTAEDLESGIGPGKEFAFQTAVDRGQVLTYEAGNYFSLLAIGGALYGSNLASGGSVDRIDLSGAITPFAALPASFIAFQPGARAFEAGAGPDGGTLYVCASDFMTYSDVVAIGPELYFRRAYINADENVNVADAIALLEYLFGAGRAPDPVVAGDVNDSGTVDIADAVYLLTYLFGHGVQPPEPFERRDADPTP
jgi:hypothetical protein